MMLTAKLISTTLALGTYDPWPQQRANDAVVEAAQRGLSFGAPTELEIEMAKLVSRIVPSMEQVRMVSWVLKQP